MRKLPLAAVTLALALAAVSLACTAGEDAEDSAGGEAAVAEAPVSDEAAEAGGGSEAMPAAQTGGGGPALPPVGPHVIQTASLELSVEQGDLDATVNRARSLAAGLGGFVVSSSASRGEDRRLVSGTLVVRVPERSYARAVERLSALGRVEAREESGEDVSQELVDLEARARHLEAVEARLLELLDDADTVQAALAVQAELNRVQLELEQVRGRLRYLDDQVAYATISLDVRERRAAAAADGGGPWGIVDAWGAAGRGFVTVVGWIFVVAATIAPVVVLLLLAYLGVRLLGRRVGPAARRSPSA
ncbi:MAG TPA: DUF4349 domain-containing protein [Gaiellaceae bacterium]|nr:DUF4349 domain-containing protein [Gaiellaceae bacterium]